MTKLFSILARTYHEIYQSIFDYKGKFKQYAEIKLFLRLNNFEVLDIIDQDFAFLTVARKNA